MRILAFADTHGETDFSHLTELAEQADLIVCAGDISFFGDDLDETFSALNDFAKSVDKQVLFVHGNHESGEEIPRASHIVNVHLGAHSLNGVVVLGFGGGGFRKSNSTVEKFLSEHAPLHTDKKQVWVFHGPPHDLVIDHVPEIGPTGCRSKRKMIDAHKPAVVIAAHIHEQWGTTHQHGDVCVVNPGPFGRLIDL